LGIDGVKSMDKIKRMVRRLGRLAVKVSPMRWKKFNEFDYWKRQKGIEGPLSNKHYKYFYTAHFGLDESYYGGKTILDIGCSPRGNFEWAHMASRRIELVHNSICAGERFPDPYKTKALGYLSARFVKEMISLEEGLSDSLDFV
jgi:hypothetical protein